MGYISFAPLQKQRQKEPLSMAARHYYFCMHMGSPFLYQRQKIVIARKAKITFLRGQLLKQYENTFFCVNPKGSNQKISDKNAWVLISTLTKPKMNGLNPVYLKSDSLQYNQLGHWVDRLIDQASEGPSIILID